MSMKTLNKSFVLSLIGQLTTIAPFLCAPAFATPCNTLFPPDQDRLHYDICEGFHSPYSGVECFRLGSDTQTQACLARSLSKDSAIDCRSAIIKSFKKNQPNDLKETLLAICAMHSPEHPSQDQSKSLTLYFANASREACDGYRYADDRTRLSNQVKEALKGMTKEQTTSSRERRYVPLFKFVDYSLMSDAEIEKILTQVILSFPGENETLYKMLVEGAPCPEAWQSYMAGVKPTTMEEICKKNQSSLAESEAQILDQQRALLKILNLMQTDEDSRTPSEIAKKNGVYQLTHGTSPNKFAQIVRAGRLVSGYALDPSRTPGVRSSGGISDRVYLSAFNKRNYDGYCGLSQYHNPFCTHGDVIISFPLTLLDSRSDYHISLGHPYGEYTMRSAHASEPQLLEGVCKKIGDDPMEASEVVFRNEIPLDAAESIVMSQSTYDQFMSGTDEGIKTFLSANNGKIKFRLF